MAVIKTMCFTSIRMWTTQGFLYCRLMFLLLLMMTAAPLHANPTNSCNLSISVFSTVRDLTPQLGPSQPIHGPICGTGSCCAVTWEQQFVVDARRNTDQYLHSALQRVAAILDARAQRFNELFSAMMNKSKREFDDMFKKTYGVIYMQNAYVFEDLFKELEDYYKTGSVQLTDTMDHFFTVLYQRMFSVINGQFDIDDKYLTCVADHMDELHPFEDVPQKLGLQLKRAFVATRIFYKSLAMGSQVAADMASHDLLPEECGLQVARMHHCGRCMDEEAVRSCSTYCIATYSTCLQHHMALGQEWDKYIDAIDRVADRLLGPFNIEMVVEPINIKISEAIMNFQESGGEVSEKVFKGCGKPKMLSRRRRRRQVNAGGDDDDVTADNEEEIPLKRIKFNGMNKKNKKPFKPSFKYININGLDLQISEIKQKIKELRQFWSHLPYQLCNNQDATVAPPSANGHCWNGSAIGVYTPENDYTAVSSTIMPTASVTQPAVVQRQIQVLQTLTNRLKEAYMGQDVDFPDEDISGSSIITTESTNTPRVALASSSSNSNANTNDDITGSGDYGPVGGSGDGDTNGGSGGGDDDGSPDDDDRDRRPSVVLIHQQPSSTERDVKVKLATAAPPPSVVTTTRRDGGEVLVTPSPPPSVVVTDGGRGKGSATAAAAAASSLEVTKTVFQYVMPIVMVWFGNALTTLL